MSQAQAMPRQPFPGQDSETVRSIAAKALRPAGLAGHVDAMLAAFDFPRLRAQLVALGAAVQGTADPEIAKLYFSGRCSALSPNAFFDEAWYVGQYPDIAGMIKVGSVISGFVHFVTHGLEEGRWPNQPLFASASSCVAPFPALQTVESAAYLRLNAGAVAFLAAFPGVDALHHYNLYGRFLNYITDPAACWQRSGALALMQAEFDAAFYTSTYLGGSRGRLSAAESFRHYAETGIALGHAPNAWFDERWYRAFYPEVREAVATGQLPCGFYHYLLAGRNEGRLAKHNLARALEARMPGICQPTLLSGLGDLERRLAGLPAVNGFSATGRRSSIIWFILPTLNPDIMFGGYRAAIELIAAVKRQGRGVGIVCSGERPNVPYFLLQECRASISAAFTDIPAFDLEEFARQPLSIRDRFVAYSIWDLPLGAQLASQTSCQPFLFMQEYEPVFYENGGRRAVCESLYRIPHHPIVNSAFLLAYLRRHKIGAFKGGAASGREPMFNMFEHRIAALPRQSAADMGRRKERLVVVYARPEAHAARNMFELVVLALRRLCAAGKFGPEWSFLGLGALSALPPVPLGGGHQLVLTPKLAEQAYHQAVLGMDIGISLMSAPHPSVMPFEFATTGALVVTNTYENRSASQLRGISENIISCDLSVEGLVAAIERACLAVPDFASRVHRVLRPGPQDWSSIFSSTFVTDCFGPSRDKDRSLAPPKIEARRRAAPSAAKSVAVLRA